MVSSRGGDGARRGTIPPRGRPLPIPPVPQPYRYAMADLEEQTGLTARTIRYYITEGLLPAANGRGPAATYELTHLLRLRLIQALKAEHVPLEGIRERLAGLSDREIEAILDIQTEPEEETWRRIVLHPDIELHVRQTGRDRRESMDEAIELIVGLTRPVIDRLEGNR